MDSLLHRVALSSWVVPGTDWTLEYCPVNCWFVAYKASRPLFTAHTLAEAEERLGGCLDSQGGA